MTLAHATTTIPVNPPQLAYELTASVGQTITVFTAPPALADTLVPGATKDVYADDGGLTRRVVQDLSTSSAQIGDVITNEMRGQSFILSGTADIADSVDLYIVSRTGAPADSILVELLDTSMTGTVLGTSATILASALTTSAYNTFTFGSPVSLSSATTYYLRVSRTGALNGANYVNVGFVTSGSVYAGGQGYHRNTGVWSADANSDMRFRVNLEGSIDATDVSNALAAHVSSITSAGEVGDFGYRLFNAGNATIKQLLNLPNLRGYDMTLREAGIHVNTAPTGQALNANILLFDTTNTQVANLGSLSIAINGTDSTTSAFTGLSHWPTAHWPNGYTVTAQITQVGSGVAGADLTFQVLAAAAA